MMDLNDELILNLRSLEPIREELERRLIDANVDDPYYTLLSIDRLHVNWDLAPMPPPRKLQATLSFNLHVSSDLESHIVCALLKRLLLTQGFNESPMTVCWEAPNLYSALANWDHRFEPDAKTSTESYVRSARTFPTRPQTTLTAEDLQYFAGEDNDPDDDIPF